MSKLNSGHLLQEDGFFGQGTSSSLRALEGSGLFVIQIAQKILGLFTTSGPGCGSLFQNGIPQAEEPGKEGRLKLESLVSGESMGWSREVSIPCIHFQKLSALLKINTRPQNNGDFERQRSLLCFQVDTKQLISYTQCFPRAIKRYPKNHLKEFYFSCYKSA